jgi:tetratricopeptide (TPR) repeat protein
LDFGIFAVLVITTPVDDPSALLWKKGWRKTSNALMPHEPATRKSGIGPKASEEGSQNKVFISYSQRDKKWLNLLLQQLAPVLKRKPAAVWWDGKIKPGNHWRKEVNEALTSATVGVLLLSSHFASADFIIKEELPYLLDAAVKHQVKLFCVLLSNFLYDELGLDKFQFLNSPSRPLNSLSRSKLDDALVSICRTIRTEIDAVNSQRDLFQNSKQLTTKKLVDNPYLGAQSQELAGKLTPVAQHIRELEKETASLQSDPETCLEMAKAFSIAGKWAFAAEYYDRYVVVYSDDWEVHFLRGVAYANSRQGRKTNVASLRAYGDAISLIPESEDRNVLARLHTYRGAILKRLNRLDQALADLRLGRKWARDGYETNDNLYNLACVYAMKKNKKQMLKYLRELLSTPGWKEQIQHKSYFKHYAQDPDFQGALEYA